MLLYFKKVNTIFEMDLSKFSNFTDIWNDTINEVINDGTAETKELEENQVADFKQSISFTTNTDISSIPAKKQPEMNTTFPMDTSNVTFDDSVNDTINDTINNVVNDVTSEAKENEEHEAADVKQSVTTKTSSISQKKQPDQLCNCPLHCDKKISKEWREKLYQQFGELGDHSWQNQFIQRHIKIKSINKRLWEDEIIDKKIQRRVTCKYLIPLTGSVKQSYSYAKTLNFDTAKLAMETNIPENFKRVNSATDIPIENGTNATETPKDLQTRDIEMKEIPQHNGNVNNMALDLTAKNKPSDNCSSMNFNGHVNSMELNTITENKSPENGFAINENHIGNKMELDQPTENKCSENGSATKENCSGISMELDTPTERKCLKNGSAIKENGGLKLDLIAESKMENGSSTKENINGVNSPASFNDNESVNTADDSNTSEPDSTPCLSVKYVDVCQKAFMNMYGITEKRIRWQREKLILRSRYLAEKQKKEMEETERTLSLARSLGAGCQPLFAFLEKSEYKQLSEQLLIAIEDDVMLVNNFFHNQLWKPEDMNKSMHLSTSLDPCETDCDFTLN